MRRLAFVLLATSALASPAAGQISPQATQQLDLLTQQQIDRQRSIALENQLNTLDARVQTEQRLRDLQAGTSPPFPRGEPVTSATGRYASIPDAALAASNARIREVTQKKR